jgi:hypothetical protein
MPPGLHAWPRESRLETVLAESQLPLEQDALPMAISPARTGIANFDLHAGHRTPISALSEALPWPPTSMLTRTPH